MQQIFYLYRFLDICNNVLYIGRTNNIERRILKEHFTSNTHLPPECYLEVARVEYAEFTNESEEVAYEAILINQTRPKYNTQFKDDAQFNVQLPNIVWKEFPWEFPGQMEVMKMLKKGLISFSDSICNVLNQLAAPNNKDCLCFGFPNIDKMAVLVPMSMTMIAGQSDTYKTSYALNIAITNAKQGKNVLYINLKDSVEWLTCRLLSGESFVSLAAIQTNSLTDENWKALASASSILDQLPISFYNRAARGCTIEDIGNAIREAQCDLVIIDDLNSIEDFDNSYDMDKNLRAMKYLKGVAIETQCSVIALYCLNSKELSKRSDKRPVLTDFGYGSLQSYNDNIQFTYIDNDSDDPNRNLEIIVAKNCIGVTGTIKLCPYNGNLIEIEATPAN